jgi:hypothetical protein
MQMLCNLHKKPMNTLPESAVAYLSSRGLAPETCEQLGIRWVSYDDAITDLYGYGKQATSPDGLILFPMDEHISIARNFYGSKESEIKHLAAMQEKDPATKKVPKYLQPAGGRALGRLYDPYLVMNPGTDKPVLFATEDVIGVARAAARGFRILSSMGVWLATRSDMQHVEDDDWTHGLAGQFPAFLADSDAIEKKSVAAALIRTGFVVGCQIGHFPSTNKDRKIGLDEWLSDHPEATESDFSDLLEKHSTDALSWLETLLPQHLSLLNDRGYNQTESTKIASPVREGLLRELIRHVKVKDLKANGFYLRVLKPMGITLKALEQIERSVHSGDQGSEFRAFDLLMEIVAECFLFRQDTEFGETYVDAVTDGIRRTYRLRSKDFKAWLTSELYSRHQKPSNSEALETCLKVCEGQARSNIESVWMRVAECDDKVYIDLCNEQWQAIEVSPHAWRIVNSVDLPVRFTRSPVQQTLPLPPVGNETNQSLNDLWDLLSIAEESKPLVTGWLLSCLVPTGDKPILVLSAPKGSGKSTIARFLVNLIDATKSALLPAVGDRRALAVQSRHRWIFAYDNLTKLSVEQQDAMCCASTGAGQLERQLFTDNDVTFVEYRRPQILTSVDLVPTRSDLLDRCLLVKVKPLPESDRKTNEELDRLFQECHAEILGTLLSLLSVALKNLDSIRQPLQRMASFHKLALASGIPDFNKTYLQNITSAQAEAVKANPIAEAIAELRDDFDGTAQELVTKLKALSDDPKVQKLTSRTIGKLLNGTLKSDLEAVGINTDEYRESDKNRTRKLLIAQPDRPSDLMSETSETSDDPQNPNKTDGFASDITSDMKPEFSDMKNLMSENQPLMSDKRPKPKALHDKDSSHVSDVSDVSDIKNDYLSGCENKEVIDCDEF